MNDEQLKEFRAMRETLDRLADGFAKYTDALAKHGGILRGQQEEFGKVYGALQAHQASIELLGRLPEQINATAALVQRHEAILQRLTGNGPGPEVVN